MRTSQWWPVGASGAGDALDVGVDDLHHFTAELKMHDKEPLNINRNFKVTPTVDEAIKSYAAELGVTPSELLRLCVYFGGPLLLTCPALAHLDRQKLAELAANIGTTLVIQPCSVEWRVQ